MSSEERNAKPGEWISRQAMTSRSWSRCGTKTVNHILADDGRTTACGIDIPMAYKFAPRTALVGRRGTRVYPDCKRCARIAQARAEHEAAVAEREKLEAIERTLMGKGKKA